jgi:futalosine hydrolase
MRTLVVTATEAESAAVVAGLADASGRSVGPYQVAAAGDVLVVVSGVGPAAAAAAAATVVAARSPELLVSAGVAGGFRESGVQPGGAVVATEIVPADLGVETEEGFLDPTALGFATAGATCDPMLVEDAVGRIRAAGLSCAAGPVLTLSAMTGTDDRARQLAARHRPVAEAMEGAGVAHVAAMWRLPVLEIRTISNLVGRREREKWQMTEALAALTTATSAVLAPTPVRP